MRFYLANLFEYQNRVSSISKVFLERWIVLKLLFKIFSYICTLSFSLSAVLSSRSSSPRGISRFTSPKFVKWIIAFQNESSGSKTIKSIECLGDYSDYPGKFEVSQSCRRYNFWITSRTIVSRDTHLKHEKKQVSSFTSQTMFDYSILPSLSLTLRS